MKVLIIQTAFIGDVILATPLIETIKQNYREAEIDFLLRKGNKGLLKNNPHIRNIYVWDKSQKLRNLFRLASAINQANERYDYVINLQRFFSTGLLTMGIKAKRKIGFAKNPLSLFYNERKIAYNRGRCARSRSQP
jgi:heptosyltransferase-2